MGEGAPPSRRVLPSGRLQHRLPLFCLRLRDGRGETTVPVILSQVFVKSGGPRFFEVVDGPGLLDVVDGPGLFDVVNGPGLFDGIDGPGLFDGIEGPGLFDGIEGPGLFDGIEGPGLFDGIEGPGLDASLLSYVKNVRNILKYSEF